jgi:hypothetical protein
MNVFRAVSADESPLLWSHGGQRGRRVVDDFAHRNEIDATAGLKFAFRRSPPNAATRV